MARILNEDALKAHYYSIVGYHLSEHHPVINDWLYKELLKTDKVKENLFACEVEPSMFSGLGSSPVLLVQDAVSGRKRRLHYEGAFDIKDAANGSLVFYQGEAVNYSSFHLPLVAQYAVNYLLLNANKDIRKIRLLDAVNSSKEWITTQVSLKDDAKKISSSGYLQAAFTEDYGIRFLASKASFDYEGDRQCNCVGNVYWKKFLRKECFVAGIYPLKNYASTFVTFAISRQGELIQCEGYKWSEPDPTVLNNLKQWLKSNVALLAVVKNTLDTVIALHLKEEETKNSRKMLSQRMNDSVHNEFEVNLAPTNQPTN